MVTDEHPSAFSRRLLVGLGLMGLAGVVGVLFQFNPTQHAFYPVCLFHRLTGWQCPGCGGLRAAHSLLHGQILNALHFNPLAVMALPMLTLLKLRSMLRETNGQSPARQPLRAGWIKLLLAVIVVFT